MDLKRIFVRPSLQGGPSNEMALLRKELEKYGSPAGTKGTATIVRERLTSQDVKEVFTALGNLYTTANVDHVFVLVETMEN